MGGARGTGKLVPFVVPGGFCANLPTIKEQIGKTCTKCETWKRFEEFRKHDGMRDGHDSWCRECNNRASREAQARARARKGPAEMFVKRHTMSKVDPETRIGTCAICGPDTKAWKRGGEADGRWRCSNKIRQQNSRRAKEDPILAKVRKIRANGIDITVEQYQGLLQSQKHLCAICKRKPPHGLHLDHNHETGAVRGLLCTTCNTGLGKFGDDPARLEAAASYLRGA